MVHLLCKGSIDFTVEAHRGCAHSGCVHHHHYSNIKHHYPLSTSIHHLHPPSTSIHHHSVGSPSHTLTPIPGHTVFSAYYFILVVLFLFWKWLCIDSRQPVFTRSNWELLENSSSSPPLHQRRHCVFFLSKLLLRRACETSVNARVWWRNRKKMNKNTKARSICC